MTNLWDSNDKLINFIRMMEYVGDHMELICEKQFTPYAWIDHIKPSNHPKITTTSIIIFNLKQKSINGNNYK